MSYYIDNKDSYLKRFDALRAEKLQGAANSTQSTANYINQLETTKNNNVSAEWSKKDTRQRQARGAYDTSVDQIMKSYTREVDDAERSRATELENAESEMEQELNTYYAQAPQSLVTMPPCLASPSSFLLAPMLKAADPNVDKIREQAAQRTYLPNVLVGMRKVAYGQKTCVLPQYIPWQSLDDKTTATEGNIMVLYDRDKAERRVMDLVDSMLVRMMMAFPVGKLRLSILEPNNYSIQRITQVLGKSEELFYKKVFRTDEEINAHLKMLTDKIDPIKQKFRSFQNTSLSLAQYNKGEIKHEYELVVVYEPFNERIGFADNLRKLMMNGISAGIYVLLVQSNYKKEELISGFNFDSFSSIIRANEKDIELMTGTRVQWNSKTKEFEGGELDDCEYLPKEGALVDPIAINGALVQDFFENINETWSKVTDERTTKKLAEWGDGSYADRDCWLNGIQVPIGVNVDKKEDVYYRADCKDYVHSFVHGTTGSGKSKLLCGIVSTITMTYSPKAVQLYLLDFKDGLAFQNYKGTPHVRWMVTTKADRTMFLTVLQDLKGEQELRSKLFTKWGVNDLNAYNKEMLATGGECLPRILLVVDECQNIYSTVEDQKGLLRQQKRINDLFNFFATECRSFGIHLLLSSQKIPSDMTWIGQVNNNFILNGGSESATRLLPGKESMAGDIQKRINGVTGSECVYCTKDNAYAYIRKYEDFRLAGGLIAARARKLMGNETDSYVCRVWNGELNVPYCKLPVYWSTEFGATLTCTEAQGIDFYDTNNVLLYGALGENAARQLTMRVVLTMLRGQLFDQKMAEDKSQCATVYVVNTWDEGGPRRSRSWGQKKTNPIEQSCRLLNNLAEHGYIQLVQPEHLGELLLQLKKQIDNKQVKDCQLYILGPDKVGVLQKGAKIDMVEEVQPVRQEESSRSSYIKPGYSGSRESSKSVSVEGQILMKTILENGAAYGIHTIMQIDDRIKMKELSIPSRAFQHFVFQQAMSFSSWSSDNAALDIETKLEQLPVEEKLARVLWYDSMKPNEEPLLVPFMLDELIQVDERGGSVGQYIMDNTQEKQQ